MEKTSKTLTKKHVVFLCRLFYPNIGGVETHVLNISRVLINRGYSVTVVTQQLEHGQPRTEQYEGTEIIRIPISAGKSKWGIWKWMIQNKDVFKHADIVHAHDVYWWYFPLRVLFAKKKSFVTFHGWEGTFPPTIKAKIWRKASELLAYKNICIGSYIKTWYGTRPDAVLFGAAVQTKREKNPDPNSIVFLGRLCRENDIHLFVEAFKRIKKRLPQVHITFVGDGNMREEAKTVGKLTGFVADPQKYMNTALWVWSSSYLSMIQAMEMGKIVCAMYSNPLKEEYILSLPPHKALIASDDPQAFADLFIHAYEDKQKQNSMIDQTHAWAKQQTWEHAADVYEDIWNA